MEYFKKCPKCGRYMTPHLRYVYGQAFTIYSCWCGYSEDTFEVRYDNKTTYTGGVERVITYEELPDGADFCDRFPDYVLAFCPDTDSWFATNQRYFFYEYSMNFSSEEEAIDYFKKNPEVFMKLEKDMKSYHPSFNEGGVYLENTKDLVMVVDGSGVSDGTFD